MIRASYTSNDETTFNFTNGSSGGFSTQVINTEILAGANQLNGGNAGILAVNVGGNILAQYNAKNGEALATPIQGINDSTLARDFSATPELAYINALNPSQTQYQSLDEIAQSWDQTTRGLTETGTAVVAVAAVAAIIATAGAAGAAVGAAASAGATAVGATAATAATVGTMAAAATAVAITTAAATFAVSATNASLNADNLGNIDDVAKTSVKETTSKESLKNIAVASVTAALTAGIAEASGLNDAVRTANAASNTTTMATQMKIALAESAISNTTSTLVQSAISNDSSSDMIKNLATNIAIGAFSNVAAKQIGAAAHSGTISKPEQLALHAGLGAITAALTGNDALSGAVSGVVGEMTGDALKSQVDSGSMTKQTAIQLAGLAGGFSSIITGEFSGQSDHEVAQNVWSGSRIGANAAQNNSFYIGGKVKIPFPGPDYDIHAGVQSNILFREDSIGTDGRGTNFLVVPEVGAGMYVYTIPHGHDPSVSTSWGYRNTISADYIRTHQGGSGFGYTVGISTAPATVVPVNVSVSIPDKNKN